MSFSRSLCDTYSCGQLQLHVFVFDEAFRTLRAQTSAIDLAPWYSQAGISILQVAFVCGKEELLVVDSSPRARIYSFISLQFRCAPGYNVVSHPMLLTSSESVTSQRNILVS